MIVTAALCWWRETPADLVRCVEGIATIADRVVALDGAYARYPGATVRSRRAEVQAITRTARRNRMEAVIIQPDRLWAGQVEKRTALFQAAAEGSDWIVVVDADHIIQADREEVRAELSRIRHDVVDVPFWTPADHSKPMAETAPGLWHANMADRWYTVALIFRSLPGMRVEQKHWWVSAVKDGLPVWLWGGDGQRTYPHHHRIESTYRVEHRVLSRSREQVLASRAFLNDRAMVVEMTGQEDDRPGLPRPVWDYVTLPE